MDIRIRATEGTDPQPFLLWDTVWNQDALAPALCDWQLAGPTAPLNSMGLKADQALNTAILLSLFTWRRAEVYDVLPAGSDPKGWWGDLVDIDDTSSEAPLGSRLWLLTRATLNDATMKLAESYAYEALQPLVDQGAVARFVCTATVNKVQGFLTLAVDAYSQDGQLIYSQKFEQIWRQEFS